MSTPSVTATCATHKKRPGVTACTQCGASVCRDCIVPTSVGVKCRNCTGVKAAQPASRAAREARPAAGGPGIVSRIRGGERPPWLYPAAAVAVLVVGWMAISIFSGGDESVDDPVGRTAAEDYPLERTVPIVSTGNFNLEGTLTLPVSRNPVAGVLIVPGFGTVDRNQTMVGRTPGGPADRIAQEVNVAGSGATDPLYKDISDALVRADIATLAYDKRGIGRSPVPEGTAITYEEVVADARAALRFMSERVELEGKPLVVLGYDQGAVIAMGISTEPGVSAVVLVSPPAKNVAEQLADHFVATHGAQGPAIASDVRALAARILAGETIPAPDSLSGHLRPMFPVGSEPYLRQVIAVDPVAEAAKVMVPALVLRGEADRYVSSADTQALLTALGRHSEEQVVAAADHNLAVEGTRAREVLSAIATWVTNHLGN